MHILFVLELIGTVSFAISGAIVGIQKKMDVFGVSILGLTTALGGGVLRDLILNITPPAAFQKPVFAVTADTEFHSDARSNLFNGVLLKPLTYAKLMHTFATPGA